MKFIQEVKNIFNEYSKQSTIHGVAYITEKNRSWFERIWWVLVVGMSIICCGKLIYDAWHIDTVIISFTEKPTSIWEIPFPTISLCSDVYTKSEYFNLVETIELQTADGELSEKQKMCMMAVNVFCETIPLGDRENATNCNECLNTLREIQIPPEDTFVECKFQNQLIDCKTSFRETAISYALCYSFNGFQVYGPNIEENHQQDWTVDDGYLPSAPNEVYPRRALGAGKKFGLSVVLRMKKTDLNYVCVGTPGFRFSYQMPHETPSIHVSNFAIGESVALVLTPNIMTISDELREYSIAERQCYLSHEQPLKYFGQYSRSNCAIECEVDLILKRCGCFQIFIEDRGDTDICGPIHRKCNFASRSYLHKQNYLECNCLPTCSSITYKAVKTTTNKTMSKTILKDDHDQYLYSQVEIYFKESEFITSQRSELYGVTGFLAKCGGLMGLCLGVSVISIFELVYFCTIRVCFKSRKEAESGHEDDIVIEDKLQSNESRAKRLANIMKNMITDYSRRTTIQGVKYVADGALTFIERLWWTIVVGASVCCCGSLIADIFRRYDETPIIISYENQETLITEIPFPAVTICSSVVTKEIGLMYHDLKVLNLSFYDFSQFDIGLVTAVAQVCDPDLFGDLDPKNQTDCKNCIPNLLLMKEPREGLLRVCIHMKTNLCSEIYKEVVTEDGVCYTYNQLAIYRESNATHHEETDEWTLEGGYRNKTGRIDAFPRAGSIYSLITVLRTLRMLNDGVCKGLINGFRVYLHLPNEVPRISKHFYLAPYQQVVSLLVSPRMVVTSPELRDFSVEKRNCFFSDERRLRFFKYYTQSNCEFECIANLTVQHCGCLRFNMPEIPGVKFCGISDIKCYQMVVEQSVERNLKNKLTSDCNCLPACTSITYDVEIDQMTVADEVFVYKYGPEFLNIFRVSEFSVLMGTNQFVALKRSQLYGKTELLANCGGLLGLFLGFSMVSILEFVYFCTIRLLCKFKEH